MDNCTVVHYSTGQIWYIWYNTDVLLPIWSRQEMWSGFLLGGNWKVQKHFSVNKSLFNQETRKHFLFSKFLNLSRKFWFWTLISLYIYLCINDLTRYNRIKFDIWENALFSRNLSKQFLWNDILCSHNKNINKMLDHSG